MTLLERYKKGLPICVSNYQVCNGCESILTLKPNICPVCASYNFITDLTRVKEAIVTTCERKISGEPDKVPDYEDYPEEDIDDLEYSPTTISKTINTVLGEMPESKIFEFFQEGLDQIWKELEEEGLIE